MRKLIVGCVCCFWVTKHEGNIQVCGQNYLLPFLPSWARRQFQFPILQETGNPAIFNCIAPCPSPSLIPPFSQPTSQFPKLSSSTASHMQLALESSDFTLCLVCSFHVSKLGSLTLPEAFPDTSCLVPSPVFPEKRAYHYPLVPVTGLLVIFPSGCCALCEKQQFHSPRYPSSSI